LSLGIAHAGALSLLTASKVCRETIRQLGEVRRHAAGLVACQQVGGSTSARLILVEVAERLPGSVADDEAGVVVFFRSTTVAGSGEALRELRSVVEPLNLVRPIDWTADHLNGCSYLLFRGQPVPRQHGLLQCGAISQNARTIV
jgi:hypothetical protein